MSDQEKPLRLALEQSIDQLGLTLDGASIDRLLAYRALLERWNRTYNLTSVRSAAEMVSHHLVDCLAVVQPLRRQLAGDDVSVLDVGSGGGLPGVVLAIVEPTWQVTCVDAVGKKAAFVRQVGVELRLSNLQAHHARVEQLDEHFRLIVSRAFAALPIMTQLTANLLADGGCWTAMKGKRPDDEIAALPASVEVFHVEPLSVPGLDAERHLIWMRPSAAAR